MIRVISSISFMFRKRMKIFSVVCAVFFSCYLGFILPLHHHKDGLVHTECMVCIAQNQVPEIAAVYCLAIFSLLVFTATVSQGRPCPRVYCAVYSIRAPPALI